MQPQIAASATEAEKLANMAGSALKDTMPPLDKQTFLLQFSEPYRAMSPPSEADWGSLPPELLALCIRSLGQTAHLETEKGWLTARQAAQLLASCCICRSWRVAALAEVGTRGRRTGHAGAGLAFHCHSPSQNPRPARLHAFHSMQLRCRVQTDAAEEVEQLAAAALPCTALCLPAPPHCADRSSLAAWAAQRRCEAAAHILLLSPAYRGSSASCLGELWNCPLDAAQSGALAGYSTLRQLGISQGLSIGQPCALRGSALPGVPPSLTQLDLSLPAGGTLDALRWPANLQRLTITAPSSNSAPGAGVAGGHFAAPTIRLQPCSCAGCWPAGFWTSLGSLHVEAPRVTVRLDACRALHSCRSMRIVAASDSQAQRGADDAGARAAESASLEEFRPWLAALAPIFAATMLRRVEIFAGSASLDAEWDGSPPVLLHSAAPGQQLPAGSASLVAAALPPGSCQSAAHGGFRAKLRHPSSSAHFGLCVARSTEL